MDGVLGQVQLRKARKTDFPLILNSWLKSYRFSYAVKQVPNDIYYSEHKRVIGELFADGAECIVACNKEDDDQIFGYVVYNFSSVPVVDWVFVKGSYQNFGIGRKLLNSVIGSATTVFFTHRTHAGEKLFTGTRFVFNPYLQNRGHK